MLFRSDLPGVRTDAFEDLVRPQGVPVVPAKAIQGEGVLETLATILSLCFRALDPVHGLSARFGVTERDFLAAVLRPAEAR